MKLYGNTVIKGNNNRGSGLQIIDVGSDNLGKHEISYCTFTSCTGNERLLPDIQKSDDDITNMTVNYCSNNWIFILLIATLKETKTYKKAVERFVMVKIVIQLTQKSLLTDALSLIIMQ